MLHGDSFLNSSCLQTQGSCKEEEMRQWKHVWMRKWKLGRFEVTQLFLTCLSLQVPQMHPTKPLITWLAQRRPCRTLATIRVMNRPMLNWTTFFGSWHSLQELGFFRYLRFLRIRPKSRKWPNRNKNSHRWISTYYLSINGCSHATDEVLHRGPLERPSNATTKLYTAPAAPTAANMMEKNICQY